MLRPAQLYRDQVRTGFINTWYSHDDQYWYGTTGEYVPIIAEDNNEYHDFVSVDENDNVLGFISYRVDWQIMSADRLTIMSFDKGNLSFVRDVYTAISNIFESYNMNRLQWVCCVDNPALKSYRNLIKRHGGKQAGYYRQAMKLIDGQLHDVVIFEIMRDEFKR